MINVAIVFYDDEIPEWVPEITDRNKSFHVIFFRYKDSPLKIKNKKQIHFVNIDKKTTIQSQAIKLLMRAQALSPQKILITYNKMSAGLFEELYRIENHRERIFGETRPDFLLFDPTIKPRQNTFTWSHKNPEHSIEWQDIFFSIDAFDDDEKKQIQLAIFSPKSVLITGEKGTGKTLLARYIHFHTEATAMGEFVERNASAFTETLIESELFGIGEGVSSGVKGRSGCIELADLGTLFLDEIGASSKNFQSKLLRVLTERVEPVSLIPIGGKKKDVLVRYIGATNLTSQEFQTEMRSDLLSRFPIHINLKNLYDKKPDSFSFFKQTINQYCEYEYRYDPSRAPKWNWSFLKTLHNQMILPGSMRDLHNFIHTIIDNRQLNIEVPPSTVSKEEINIALEMKMNFESNKNSITTQDHFSVENLKSIFNDVESLNDLQGLPSLTKEEVMELVYLIKKYALEVALSYSNGKKTLAKNIYSGETKSYTTFKQILDNPMKLHPGFLKNK